MPGSIRSSTIASYSTARAIQSASSPVAGDISRVALLDEAALEQPRELRLVLDDQDAHRLIVSRRMRAG